MKLKLSTLTGRAGGFCHAEATIKKGELAALKLQDEISVDLYASYICNPSRWINPVMKEFIRIVQTFTNL